MVEPIRILMARGGSMGPFIPAGSSLLVDRVDPTQITRGDVLCFIDGAGSAVAHRVIDICSDSRGVQFVIRGDAQTVSELVPAEAVIYRVQRVEFRGVSYSTSSRVGLLLSAVARGETPSMRVVKRGLSTAWRGLCAGHRVFKRMRNT